MERNIKTVSIFASAIWIIISLLYLLDSVGSKTTVIKYLYLPSWKIFLLFFLILILLRLIFKIVIKGKVFPLTGKFIFPLLIIPALLLGIIEALTSDNAVYSLTRINPEILAIFAHSCLAIYIISLDSQYIKKKLSLFLKVFPFWFLGISLWVKILPFDAFVTYAKEDMLVESIQVLILFVCLIFLFLETVQRIKREEKKETLIYILLILAVGFILFEEISWGQRIFNFTTPDFISRVNIQNEITLHNIGIMNSLQILGYIIISFFGSLGYILKKMSFFKRGNWIAPRIAIFYFFIPFIFYSVRLFTTRYFQWAEIVEVLFYGGFFVWIADKTKLLKKFI